MNNTLEKNAFYTSDFQASLDRKSGSAPSWLAPLKKAAFSRFTEMGYPTRHHEEWRFTIITPLLDKRFVLATEVPNHDESDLDGLAFISQDFPRLVFVNGRYSEKLSVTTGIPGGVRAGSIAQVLQNEPSLLENHLGRNADIESQPFTALNTAFLEDGAVVIIPAGKIVEQPIQVVYISVEQINQPISHPRTLIVAGENSQSTIIESYVSKQGTVSFSNAVTEVAVGANAVVDHYKLQRESETAYHIGSMAITMARNANFSSHSLTLGGAITRNEVTALLGNEGCECTLNGVYLADGARVVDNHTSIDHAMPHCNSHEVYKGILDDKAHGVFNGKIFVRQDAQKTDAKQTNKTLLLSEDAQINTKPQLEIFADDVKCTHGATIGQLNEEALFYLRARGIGLDDARSMLIHAFASDVIDRIKIVSLREEIDMLLFELLPGGS